MQKIVSLVFICTILQACSFPGVYKINVQQGNIVTQEMLDTLKSGMTKKQVHFVLGNPVVDNIFNPNIEHYLYTYQEKGGDIKQQKVSIFYQSGKFSHHESQLLEEHPAY